MTIYVDQLPEGWGKWSYGAHMLGTNIFELHHVAREIGLKREWFQSKATHAHYDLTYKRRKLAIAAGAVEIPFGVIPDDILMLNRETGGYEPRYKRFARKGLVLDFRTEPLNAQK